MQRVLFIQLLAFALPFIAYIVWQRVRHIQGKAEKTLPVWPLIFAGAGFSIVTLFVLLIVTIDHQPHSFEPAQGYSDVDPKDL
ncbi:hypothetical protein [Woodsholea maritima]|uniref:hypothetical protein n=1 Tax=Woodsholea maritima TaxID=240237 RepID=UPI00036B247D|nr:hypothetical protein [Woodsholea maritima]